MPSANTGLFVPIAPKMSRSRRSKKRGRPIPDAVNVKQIIFELEKALILENKYKSNLLVAHSDQRPGEVELTARDSAVQTLRFLKFWLDLPSHVFFTCVSILDRFLTKMKVNEKYLACISISCLYVASDIHKCCVSASQLVNISQTKCSVKDVERMSDIVRKKLEIESKEQPVTVYNYLNLFLRIFDCAALQLNVKSLYTRMLQKKVLRRRLEVVMTDSHCASDRPAVVALALIQCEIERFLAAEIPSKSPYYSVEMLKLLTVIVELQCVCMVASEEFVACYSNLDNTLKKYDDGQKLANVHKMQWRFSTSTLLTPKPLDNFCTNLYKITDDDV